MNSPATNPEKLSRGEKLYLSGIGAVVHAICSLVLVEGIVRHFALAALVWWTWPIWLVPMLRNKGTATWGFYVPLVLSLSFLALAAPPIFFMMAILGGGRT
jgi:hypothetical protein